MAIDREYLGKVLAQIRSFNSMSNHSKQLLLKKPKDYSVSRSRQLRAALLNDDGEMVETFMTERTSMVGSEKAAGWKLAIMGDIVKESLEEQDIIN